MKTPFHLVLRVAHAPKPLHDLDVAIPLLRALRRAFPHPHAACIMPNHLHLMHRLADAGEGRRRIGAMRSGLSRSHTLCRDIEWEPMPAPQPGHSPAIVRRMSRYVHLNPERAALVDKAIEWPLSTYRDALGAVADPWLEPSIIAEDLQLRGPLPRRMRELLGDGPAPACPPAPELVSLRDVLAASLAATRSAPLALLQRSPTRHIFLALAAEYDIPVAVRARLCGVTREAIYLRHPLPHAAGLDAARLCLAERSLRVAFEPAATEHIARHRHRPTPGRPSPTTGRRQLRHPRKRRVESVAAPLPPRSSATCRRVTGNRATRATLTVTTTSQAPPSGAVRAEPR